MLIASSLLVFRRIGIINKLIKKGAVSPETAVTFKEARILFPNSFLGYTKRMLAAGVLCRSGRRFYIDVTKKDARV